MPDAGHPWPPTQRFVKRGFDLLFSVIGILLFSPVIILAWIVSALETGSNGFFLQDRIGRGGCRFSLIKIKTMMPVEGVTTVVTAASDPRISRCGRIFRRTKIDELPQLFNVLAGQMSLVGPRPDVPGYADKLIGDDRLILCVRPGITGPAALKYKNEEELLSQQADPERYNDEVIWPDKVRINREYIENYSFGRDLAYLWNTIF